MASDRIFAETGAAFGSWALFPTYHLFVFIENKLSWLGLGLLGRALHRGVASCTQRFQRRDPLKIGSWQGSRNPALAFACISGRALARSMAC